MNEPREQDWMGALRRHREAPLPGNAEARVAARLGLALGPGAAESGLRKAAASGASAGLWRAVALLGVTFAAGAATGAGGVYASLAHRRAVPVVDVSAKGAATVAESVARAPFTSEPMTTGASSPGPAQPGLEKQDAPSPRRDQLDVERELLDRARSALLNDEIDGCLHVLDQYARAYRRPILAEEHDALLVHALVRAGRGSEARARAEDYRRKFPNGLLRSAVDAALMELR